MDSNEANVNIKNKTFKKWFTFVVLVIGGGTIFKLSSLKDAFYVPMQEFMGLSNTQIGLALSVYGLVQLIGNFFSIYIADRFSKKILIPVGLIGVGLIGLYLTTFPAYWGILVSWGLLSLFGEVIYWPVLLKAIRLLGTREEQGRLFGFLESGRGVIDIIVAFSALGLFVTLGKNASSFRVAISFFAIVVIIVGIVSYFLLENDVIKTVDESGNKISKNKVALLGMWQAIKTLEIWIVSLMIFCAYSVYCGLTYFIPFLNNIYLLPVGMVGAYGIINQYGLKLVGGPTGGFLSDKLFKSPTKYIRFALIISAIYIVIIAFLPHRSMNVYLGMFLTLSFGAVIFTIRAVFFAPIEEIRVPREITGAAMSIACIFGYSPQMFAFALYGFILDQYPKESVAGYKIIFFIMSGFSILGALVATFLLYLMKRKKGKNVTLENVTV